MSGIGLAEEGEEELGCAGGGEGEGEGVAGVMAVRKLAEEDEGEERGCYGGVESDRVERGAVGWDAETPGECCGEAGVAAFGEVSEGEERPGEGGARGPGVESVERREMAKAEVDRVCEDGEEDAGGGERGNHQEEDGVGEEVVQVCGDEKEAGECEGGEEGEEACVPELVGVEADDGGGAEAEGEGRHESHGSEDAEGGKKEMAGVDEVGMHGRAGETRDERDDNKEGKATAKTKCGGSSTAPLTMKL